MENTRKKKKIAVINRSITMMVILPNDLFYQSKPGNVDYNAPRVHVRLIHHVLTSLNCV